MTSPGPFRFEPSAQGPRATVSSRPGWLVVGFAVLWLAGWFLLLTLTVLEYVRFGRVNLAFTALLVGGGVPVALALLWVAWGKRESLLIAGDTIRIERMAGPFRLSRTFAAGEINAITIANVTEGPLADLVALRQFYGRGNGRLAFDTHRGVYSFGHGLPHAAAVDVLGQVRQLVPTYREAVVATRATPSRLASHMSTLMTMGMLGFALNVPIRLAITDRAICFYDQDVTPRSPIDISSLPRNGRIVLVPLDEFPVARAETLAAHFRTALSVPIDVAAPLAWPAGARNDDRGQMNSSVMLDHLEAAYPAGNPRVVAIALSMRDLYNPGVGWHYVFSYRRHNRVAVVSPVRMDRGCMGVMPADESRVLSRLRKMVGKNIGIMYFGLDLSDDPASMLYGNIGGPQELDAMSERF